MRRLSPPVVLVALRALGAVAALAASAGCDDGPTATGSVDGAAIFGSLCASCHGADGRPPASMAARLGVRDLTSPEFRARATPRLVEQQIRSGSSNKLMPSFVGAINDAQIKAVAVYVASPQFVAPR